jgi:hypothetical protein
MPRRGETMPSEQREKIAQSVKRAFAEGRLRPRRRLTAERLLALAFLRGLGR